MSMNEFDQELNNESNENLFLTALEHEIPPDFGEDDLLFAHELNSIFSPEQEELPPYFVQTLLASEDQLFRPVESGFEHKTRARVFRRLKLKRRLFRTPRSIFDAFTTGLSNIYARGSLLASAVAFMLIMLVTVAFTAPSFASGMTILLQGYHGGVYQVNTYPNGVHTFKHQRHAHNNSNDQSGHLTVLDAEQLLHFNIYYPQSLPHNYSLESLSLYHGAAPLWINGPVVELVYSLTGVKPKGTGQIVIREFLPTEEVLPVVLDKAVHLIHVDQYGQPAAIFINGQWQSIGKNSYNKWFFGGRSELIYQQNGVLFWIAGDQIDGIGEKALWNLAQSMSQKIPFNHNMRFEDEMPYISQANLSDIQDPFTHDSLKIFSDDNPSSAYYVSVSYDPSETPIPQSGTHSH